MQLSFSVKNEPECRSFLEIKTPDGEHQLIDGTASTWYSNAFDQVLQIVYKEHARFGIDSAKRGMNGRMTDRIRATGKAKITSLASSVPKHLV